MNKAVCQSYLHCYTCQKFFFMILIAHNVTKIKRVCVHHLYTVQADSSKSNPRMQAVEIINSTFIVELEGSIYPNRTQEECNSMKKHVNHLVCIMTPWPYFVAHYGCRQMQQLGHKCSMLQHDGKTIV